MSLQILVSDTIASKPASLDRIRKLLNLAVSHLKGMFAVPKPQQLEVIIRAQREQIDARRRIDRLLRLCRM